MSSRKHRRRLERHRRLAAAPATARLSARDLRTTSKVERLAYTRRQAAEALGVSLATLDRRVVPIVETVKTEWGARLIPVDELERYLAERRQQIRSARCRPEPPGRKSGLDPELIARIRRDYSAGQTLADIARRLNGDGVRTSQGGRQWWPSTVRAVLIRPHPPKTA
jgi:hypothetical protein